MQKLCYCSIIPLCTVHANVIGTTGGHLRVFAGVISSSPPALLYIYTHTHMTYMYVYIFIYVPYVYTRVL